MTEDAKRIALAKEMGWQKAPYSDTDYYVPMLGKLYVACDPLNDLNAAHEMEKTMQLGLKRTRYLQFLIPEEDLSPENEATNANVWTICHASASDRADAFLKVKGLLK